MAIQEGHYTYSKKKDSNFTFWRDAYPPTRGNKSIPNWEWIEKYFAMGRHKEDPEKLKILDGLDYDTCTTNELYQCLIQNGFEFKLEGDLLQVKCESDHYLQHRMREVIPKRKSEFIEILKNESSNAS
jgi:hypothetical protein